MSPWQVGFTQDNSILIKQDVVFIKKASAVSAHVVSGTLFLIKERLDRVDSNIHNNR